MSSSFLIFRSFFNAVDDIGVSFPKAKQTIDIGYDNKDEDNDDDDDNDKDVERNDFRDDVVAVSVMSHDGDQLMLTEEVFLLVFPTPLYSDFDVVSPSESTSKIFCNI